MNTKFKCVHCGDPATKIIKEIGVEIPLCSTHYKRFLDEEDIFSIEGISKTEEEDDQNSPQ